MLRRPFLVGRQRNTGFEVEGTVVIMTRELLEFYDLSLPSVIGGLTKFLGMIISIRLVSATVGDPNNEDKGFVGEPAFLKESSPLCMPEGGESKFRVRIPWDRTHGIPGAVIVQNHTVNHFYLKSITLENFPREGRIHFSCHSWVYHDMCYNYQRIFFANVTYLPEETPMPLRPYRDEELSNLRGGDNCTRKFEEWDRVYDYATYNDLGEPDLDDALSRPVLGGSDEYPYPRRGRTNRRPLLSDPNSEKRLPVTKNIYVPRDERFGHIKQSDFQEYSIKGVVKMLLPLMNSLFTDTPNEFESFEDMMQLYEEGMPLPNGPLVDEIQDRIPLDLLQDIIEENNGGERILKLSMPHVIQVDETAWRTDEEFGREMIAGVNPVSIRRLEEFPPTSKLDPEKYGNQTSTMSETNIGRLYGLTIEQALANNKLYILDHHDVMMPYLSRINNTTPNKVYATRTLLFLKKDGTLRPRAIELSLPHPKGEKYGAVSRVFRPAVTGVKESIWQLAKAYVAVTDSGVHQLISHWLNTHACMEPFVIATNRQLSVMHPIYKLLQPHYRDTMSINALARQSLINAKGIVETTFFPAKYSMEMTSMAYRSWNFIEQGIPSDLLKRGVAVEDLGSPTNIRLLIKDYPYAVDGLAIWSAIETWVTEYCSIYYLDDLDLQSDDELMSWWIEIRDVGHGDKKDEPWWPEMDTVSELIQICTTIIWIASALHAAVNFGQFPYAGYNPNRPTTSRRFMPEMGSEEYEELETNPDKVFLRTITSQQQTLLALSIIEILSTHSSDEVYLGQRPTEEWTTDQDAVDAFERFKNKLAHIEETIKKMNQNPRLKNRNGPVKMPYTLLCPTSEKGITMKGIPNSISI